MGLAAYLEIQKNGKGEKFEIGYWEKANAIHKWFVDHVQNGKDDNSSYEVSKEQLDQLLKDCRKVRAAYHGRLNKIIKRILPTKSGLFFGNTKYNSGYLDDIEQTIKILESALEMYKSEHKFYYQSSW
jgi:hypothetical protein